MTVGLCQIWLRLPENHSLKGKRQVIKSLVARIHNRFNVAVAEFAAGKSADRETALGISEAAFQSITRDLFRFEEAGEIENLETAGPSAVGGIGGDTLEERATAAGSLAADINADDAEATALATDRIQTWLADGEVRKVIVRPPKLVNIVVS